MTTTNFNRFAAAAVIAAFAFPAAALAQDIDVDIEDLGEQIEIATVEKADAVIASRLEALDTGAAEAPANNDTADTLLLAALR